MDYSRWDSLDYDSDEELCKPPDSACSQQKSKTESQKATRVLNQSRNLCWTCYAPGAVLRCGRCKQVFFCSADCQQRGWRRHKFQCRVPEDTAASSRRLREMRDEISRQAKQEELGQGLGGEPGPFQRMLQQDAAEHGFVMPPIWPEGNLSLAVVIPFRQQLPLQNRGPHLEQLVARLHEMLARLAEAAWLRRWRLLVVEQAPDARQFNRGALLNAGFDFLDSSGESFDQVVFHDADLLPDSENTEVWYAAQPPAAHIIHLTAQGYEKYEGAKRTAGTAPGVVLQRWSDFKQSNGFPLNVWGWAEGLEDQVWFDRLGAFGMRYYPCPIGAWRDLDGVDFANSLQALEKPELYYDYRWLSYHKPEMLATLKSLGGSSGPAAPDELLAWLQDRRGGLDTPDFYSVLREEPCLGHATLIQVLLKNCAE